MLPKKSNSSNRRINFPRYTDKVCSFIESGSAQVTPFILNHFVTLFSIILGFKPSLLFHRIDGPTCFENGSSDMKFFTNTFYTLHLKCLLLLKPCYKNDFLFQISTKLTLLNYTTLPPERLLNFKIICHTKNYNITAFYGCTGKNVSQGKMSFLFQNHPT